MERLEIDLVIVRKIYLVVSIASGERGVSCLKQTS